MKKMNFKYLLFAAAMLVGFASCQNDEPNIGGDVVPNKNKTFASVRLVASSMNARAAGDNQDPSVQSPGENTISDATLYNFNANKTLEGTLSFTDQASALAGETFETTDGTHYFYLVINKPSSFPASIPVGTVMADFEKLLINITDLADITTANSFYMTNVATPGADVLAEWDGTGSAPASNTIEISVGRGMAKVNVEFPSSATQPVSGVLSDVSYAVFNNPNQMFVMPVIRKAPLDFIGSLETPFFEDNSVVADPIDASDYFPYMDETAVKADLASITLNPTVVDTDSKAAATAKAVYAIENSNRNPRFGNATFVLLQGTFKPSTVYDATDAVDAGYAKSDDFWLLTYSVGTDKYNVFYSADPAAIADDAIESRVTTLLAGADPGDIAAAVTAAQATKEVLAYGDGECFYGVWLADQSIGTDKAVDRFTVKRNNYYYIYINDVSGVGSNEPGGVIPDPEKPIVTKVNISVKIDILNWTPILQVTGI